MIATSIGAVAELRRGGALVFACTVGFGFSLSGIPFYTLGVFVDPLHDAFGWSVAAIQAGLTVSFLTTMLVLPLVAWLTDRVGARRVAMVSLVAMSLAFMSLSRLDGELWLYYAHWALIALCGTGSLAVTWTGPITRAFSSARGLALGLSLLGTGVMGVLAPPVARLLVDTVGWRGAFVWLGAAPIVFALPPTWRFFHDRTAAEPRAPAPRGRPAALNDPRLAMLAVAIMLVAMAVAGVIPNLIKALTSGGLSRAEAVAAASAVGVFVVVGRVGCGALIDRFWAPAVAAGFLVASALACAALAVLHVNALGAALAAALIGLSAGAEFDLLPFMVSRYFAADRYTRTLGVMSSAFYLGAAAGGPALGWVYDREGSYALGLAAAAAALLLSAASFLTLGKYRALSPDVAEAPLNRSAGSISSEDRR